MIIGFGLMLTGFFEYTKEAKGGPVAYLLAISVLVCFLFSSLKNEGILTENNAPKNLSQ